MTQILFVVLTTFITKTKDNSWQWREVGCFLLVPMIIPRKSSNRPQTHNPKQPILYAFYSCRQQRRPDGSNQRRGSFIAQSSSSSNFHAYFTSILFWKCIQESIKVKIIKLLSYSPRGVVRIADFDGRGGHRVEELPSSTKAKGKKKRQKKEKEKGQLSSYDSLIIISNHKEKNFPWENSKEMSFGRCVKAIFVAWGLSFSSLPFPQHEAFPTIISIILWRPSFWILRHLKLTNNFSFQRKRDYGHPLNSKAEPTPRICS